MQMSINEKEAEIIRLNLCLGDEKKKVSDMQSNCSRHETSSTPSRNKSASKLNHHNSVVEINLPRSCGFAVDSPYF